MSVPRDEDDKRADQVSFLRTVNAFRQYSASARAQLETRKRSVTQMPSKHREIIGGDEAVQGMFAPHELAIDQNQRVLDAIADEAPSLYGSYWPNPPSPPATAEELRPTPLDLDKVYSTLRQFVRDWAAEGFNERQSIYAPITQVLMKSFPVPGGNRVLLPGAGLSRLSVELAACGFDVQGNEFSYHMLIAGHFAMNHCQDPAEFLIQPFCDTTINNFSRRDQFRAVPVPDVSAVQLMESADARGVEFGELSMVAGDFVEVFSKPGQREEWNAVVTCFFVDTAHDIVQYITILFDILVPGGVWINTGPLLFHYSDQPNEISVDVTYEELKVICANVGFEVVEEATVTTGYTNNGQSMKQMLYHCPFFWCRKPA
jgi:carnosine N-methyltransferase